MPFILYLTSWDFRPQDLAFAPCRFACSLQEVLRRLIGGQRASEHLLVFAFGMRIDAA